MEAWNDEAEPRLNAKADAFESLRTLLQLSREIAMMLDVTEDETKDEILDAIGVAEVGVLRVMAEEGAGR